jgi:hypothetical protein
MRERVYRCRNEEGVRFGDGFAQEVNQCVLDAGVADTGGSEKKLHNEWLKLIKRQQTIAMKLRHGMPGDA